MKIPFFATLTERITLQTPTTTSDGAGGILQTWSTLAVVWAAVESRSARQSLEADQQQTLQRYTVTLRNRSDIGPGMRVLWRGQTLRVTALPEGGTRPAYRALECQSNKGIA